VIGVTVAGDGQCVPFGHMVQAAMLSDDAFGLYVPSGHG
jgi:hypothetical protein